MTEERLLALEIHHTSVNEAASEEVLELIAEIRRLKRKVAHWKKCTESEQKIAGRLQKKVEKLEQEITSKE